MIHLLRNARLVAGVVGPTCPTIPVLLVPAVYRGCPRVVRPLARLACGFPPNLGGSSGAARSAHDEVTTPTLSDASVSPQRTCRGSRPPAGRFALAAALPRLSDATCWRRERPVSKSAQARRFWHDGASAKPSTFWTAQPAAGKRPNASGLPGNSRLLEGAAPSLARRGYFTPVPGRVLHLLTNSLPHTASGYAQRSHSILVAQQQAGWEVLAVTRLGYPVQVGKFVCAAPRCRGRCPLPAAPSRPWPPPWMRACSNRPRSCCAWPWSSGRACCTPPPTRRMDWGPGRGRGLGDPLGLRGPRTAGGHLGSHPGTRRPGTAKSTGCSSSGSRSHGARRPGGDAGQAMKANIRRRRHSGREILIAPNAVGGEFLGRAAGPVGARRELGLLEGGQPTSARSAAWSPTRGSRTSSRPLPCSPRTPGSAPADRGGWCVKACTAGTGPPRRLQRPHHLSWPGAPGTDRPLPPGPRLFVVPRKDLDVTRS